MISLLTNTVFNSYQWYHVAVTFDGSGNIDFFLDGELKEEDKTIPLDQVITLDHLTNPDKK